MYATPGHSFQQPFRHTINKQADNKLNVLELGVWDDKGGGGGGQMEGCLGADGE